MNLRPEDQYHSEKNKTPLLTFQGISTPRKQLVEHMEAPLTLVSENDSALLEQVPIDIRACDAAIGRKHDSNKLSKST
jgi:hypothetical protein